MNDEIDSVNDGAPASGMNNGTVRIDAFVGKDGRAHSLKVISGDPRLSSATLAAVSNWTFRPAQLDGESVESEVTISVNFDLH